MNEERLRKLIQASKIETSSDFTKSVLEKINMRDNVSPRVIIWSFKKVLLTLCSISILLMTVIFLTLSSDQFPFFKFVLSRQIVLVGLSILFLYSINLMVSLYDSYKLIKTKIGKFA